MAKHSYLNQARVICYNCNPLKTIFLSDHDQNDKDSRHADVPPMRTLFEIEHHSCYDLTLSW